MPRAENKTTPKVVGGVLYTDVASFGVETPQWWSWLVGEGNTTFYVETNEGMCTARRETRKRSTGFYWYAYRRYKGRLAKCYLGKSEELTKSRLSKVVRQLTNKLENLSGFLLLL